MHDYEITGQSLLIRDALQNLKFAHESIREYFLAEELFNNKDFRLGFDFTGNRLAKLFYTEISDSSYPKGENIKLSVEEVFGVSNDVIGSYIERKQIDHTFRKSLKSRKHIVVYGSSKQGKTSLLKQNISEEKYTKTECAPNMRLVNIYSSILRQNGVRLIENIDEKSSKSSGVSSSVKAKVEIPTFVSSEAGMNISEKRDKSQSINYKKVSYDITLVQDVIEILKDISFVKFIVIENFHYLPIEEQYQFAFDLRTFQDENIIFIILGIWREKNRLSQYNGDLQDRLEDISVEPWEKEEFRKIIEKGSGQNLLNLNMKDVENDIIEASFGSVGVLQELCKYSCSYAIGFDKLVGNKSIYVSRTNFKNAIEKKVDEYSARYYRSLEALAIDDHYRYLPFFLLNIVLSTETHKISFGLTKDYIREYIDDLWSQQVGSKENVVKFLSEITPYQIRKKINPPIFDYDVSIGKLSIIDSTFYFFHKYCNRQKILSHIKDIRGHIT